MGLLTSFGRGVTPVCNETFNPMEVVRKLDALEVAIKPTDGLTIL